MYEQLVAAISSVSENVGGVSQVGEHINALLRGEEVMAPVYDMKSGCPVPRWRLCI